MKLFIYLCFLPLFSNQELFSINSHSFHNLSCPERFYVRILSIDYFYRQYNCTLTINRTQSNHCLNQTSCTVDFKAFFHAYLLNENNYNCQKIKFKSIQVNYTCLNQTTSNDMLIQAKYPSILLIISICFILIGLVSLFVLIYLYIQRTQKQKYQLKTSVIMHTSSITNPNRLTNTSDYDNLMKTNLAII